MKHKIHLRNYICLYQIRPSLRCSNISKDDYELRMYISFRQHCAPARRICGNYASKTLLIVHNNYSNNGINKKKTKWKSYYMEQESKRTRETFPLLVSKSWFNISGLWKLLCLYWPGFSAFLFFSHIYFNSMCCVINHKNQKSQQCHLMSTQTSTQ